MISFQVIGAQAIAAKFAAAATIVPAKAVPSGLDKAGLLVLRRAKQKAPVDTGTLMGSIMKIDVSPAEVDAVAFADYSVYVEFGTGIYAEGGGGRQTPWVYPSGDGFVTTSGSPAQPYMRPALDENKTQIEALIGKAVITTIEGVMY